ncbi:YbhB/YbcL family Raf kinase inhibitor-like protein [Streptomyces sp. NPDC001530]|uniref:YbhB/YbcL family Raf kinase inhibitor-like protein n=1 Tax=Streptomyces sp. NPDC001530 TaxID=3364582 RepID=UPI0036A817DF
MSRKSRRKAGAIAAAAMLGLAAGCGGDGGAAAASGVPTPHASKKITVTSPAFADSGTIPRRYTCDGENVSPSLEFSGVPDDAAELVVLVEDPDAPRGTFVHWVVWGIDPHETGLGTGAVPSGAEQGRNGFGKSGYGGPCPPKGKPHRYVFSVFAADAKPTLSKDASADDVRRALAGHTAAYGTLVGLYGR